MRRRDVVLAAGALFGASLVRAQAPARPFRVGHVSVNSLQTRKHLNDALELGLREQGYVIGQNLVMEQVAGDGQIERLPELVREMLARRPDVIVTGANVVTHAVRAQTTRIPIVMALGLAVIDQGFAKSLARPGGNVTGVTLDVDDSVVVKSVELLREMLPKVARVGVLWESQNRRIYEASIERIGAALGLAMRWVEFSGDLEGDFAEIRRQRADALLALTATRGYRRAAEMTAIAVRHRLPGMFYGSEFVAGGGLMSYFPNMPDLYRRAASHVHRVLRGANPGDLPVERPLLIDLEINLATARALGLKVPQPLLLRAARVIE